MFYLSILIACYFWVFITDQLFIYPFSAPGGNTVYFGEIGENSKIMADYFERNGARPLLRSENPAEYILEVVKMENMNWCKIWLESKEREIVHKELVQWVSDAKTKPSPGDSPREFATSQVYQAWELYRRLNLVWWRNPQYK